MAGAAIAGAVLGIIGGLIGVFAMHKITTGESMGVTFAVFDYAYYLLPAVLAVISLLPLKRRLLALGGLQGACWVATSSLVWDITYGTAGHLFSDTGVKLLTAADTVLVAALVLVLIACHPAGGGWASGFKAIPALLVGGVVLGQIGGSGVILLIPGHPGYYWFGAVMDVVIGLAVAVYAMRLRSEALGGSVLAGFAGLLVLNVGTWIFSWSGMKGTAHVSAAVAWLLLVAVMVGAIIRSVQAPLPGGPAAGQPDLVAMA